MVDSVIRCSCGVAQCRLQPTVSYPEENDMASKRDRHSSQSFRQEKIRRELNQKARRAAEHRALRAREAQPIGVINEVPPSKAR